MRVLIVDNNLMPEYWGAKDLVRMIPANSGASIHVRRGPHGDLPDTPRGFDRIVVSGSLMRADDASPWTLDLERMLRSAGDQGVPVLGICYGHQMIARSFGGIDHVGNSEVPEHGWTHITVQEKSPLTKGLPRSFHSFSAHYEEVKRLPRDFKALASSDACALQAMCHQSKPIYGLQFHPEKTAEEGYQTFLLQQKKGEGARFLNARRDKELYDPKIGETLFRNFISGTERP